MVDYEYIENARKRVKVKKGAIADACRIPARRVGEILAGSSHTKVEDLEAVLNEIGLTLSVVRRIG